MSIHFSHGGPGGYKTSHVILSSLDVLFKTDRFFFSNVDGLSLSKLIPTFSSNYSLTLHQQFELYNSRKETFYNVSSDFSVTPEQSRILMRYCPYWLPIGSFVLLDEVQLFYPVSFSQRDFDLDFLKLEAGVIELLDNFRSRFKRISAIFFDKNLDFIKKQFSELYDVSLESSDFDEKFKDYFEKKVLYRPINLKEFFSMHRHWNFDFEMTCQDLDQVSRPVLHVAEGAHYHKNMGVVSHIFTGTYRTYFHSMLTNSPSKNDVGQKHKIDKRVFQCYKSTSVGTHLKTRVSQNLFGSAPVVKAMVGIIFILVSLIYFLLLGLPTIKTFFNQGIKTNANSTLNSNSISPNPQSSPSVSSSKEASRVHISENTAIPPQKSSDTNSSVFNSGKSNKALDNFLAMRDEFKKLEIFVNGFSYSSFRYSYAGFIRHPDGSITKFRALPPLFKLVPISTCFYSLFWKDVFIKYVFCYSPSSNNSEQSNHFTSSFPSTFPIRNSLSSND